MKTTGKWNLVLGLWLTLGMLSTAWAGAPVRVPVGSDLSLDARQVRASGLPIMLVFSAEECTYCELLEEEFLKPMLLSGDYGDQIIIRKLILDNGSYLRDFQGSQVDASDLSLRYRVPVTPTILFLDAQGNELVPRMVGINTIDFFGGYLDQSIAEARARLVAQQRQARLVR